MSVSHTVKTGGVCFKVHKMYKYKPMHKYIYRPNYNYIYARFYLIPLLSGYSHRVTQSVVKY